MWTPKDLIGGIRRLFASNTVAAVEKYDWHQTGEVFARATPEAVRIVETYSYQQEISRNRNLQSDQSRRPAGRIEITLPYDGDHYFTRQASSDVAAQVPPDNANPVEALVGHLVLADYGKADFGLLSNPNGGFAAIPIRVPVSGGVLPEGYGHLADDRTSCVINHGYWPDPDQPEILPVTVSIELLDPDSAGFMEITGRTSNAGANLLAKRIRQLGTFESYLEFRVKVQVHIAGSSPDLCPEVSLVSIGWPKVTSLSSFDLSVPEAENAPQIRYNPVTRSIEWRDVQMAVPANKAGDEAMEGQDTEDDEDQTEDEEQAEEKQDKAAKNKKPHDEDKPEPAIRTYESPTMSLLVQQPGELYHAAKLEARVDVRIPQLLSGMDARLYGGTGRLTEKCQPELVSEVSTRIVMILDDAFAERTVSTYQRLHFAEVVPDAARIEDIRNALAGHGFESLFDRKLDDDPYLHLLVHRRREGPDTMELWYLVEGRRFTTDREKVVAGETLVTPVESGDLNIFVYGTLRTSSREVTRAMNALQQVLRSPFAHVRVRR